MKFGLSLILLLILVPAFVADVVAEDQPEKPDAALTADNLRLKLIDVQAEESELQARARQLEEDVKPESIERSLAGIGSTKPEELREFRRRQINIELESVRNKLRILATSRERLESAIRTADGGLSTECGRPQRSGSSSFEVAVCCRSAVVLNGCGLHRHSGCGFSDRAASQVKCFLD